VSEPRAVATGLWVRSRPDCLCGAMLKIGQSGRLRTQAGRYRSRF